MVSGILASHWPVSPPPPLSLAARGGRLSYWSTLKPTGAQSEFGGRPESLGNWGNCLVAWSSQRGRKEREAGVQEIKSPGKTLLKSNPARKLVRDKEETKPTANTMYKLVSIATKVKSTIKCIVIKQREEKIQPQTT